MSVYSLIDELTIVAIYTIDYIPSQAHSVFPASIPITEISKCP